MTREQLRDYLTFYEDLGVKEVYRRKGAAAKTGKSAEVPEVAAEAAPAVVKKTASPVIAAAKPAIEVAAPVVKAKSVAAPPTIAVAAEAAGLTPISRVAIPSLAPEGDTLAQIRADVGDDCKRCRLCEQRNKIVFGSGNEEARLVFVGEGPGADEDAQGLPFIGRAGQLLTQMIEATASKEGIPIKRPDVYICNVVKCRPPENRAPQPDEMEICGQFLFRQLMAIRPTAICALGSTAAKALLGTKEGVTRLRGNWLKWRDIPLMVTYHPSYLLRPYNQDAKRESWEDLKKVLHFVYD